MAINKLVSYRSTEGNQSDQARVVQERVKSCKLVMSEDIALPLNGSPVGPVKY